MEIGVLSFGELGPGDDPAARMAALVDQAVRADELGFDVFGAGEHHRADFVVASPPVVLAAVAARTSRIRLTSAVTVLGAHDPVRVFQDFATLDLVSGGRAEIVAGRGAFTEAFGLYGRHLDDYDALFAEGLELLLAVRAQERVTWAGRFRPPLAGADVQPRPVQSPLPVWLAAGGTPRSLQRAGTLGLPLALDTVGGAPERFAPQAAVYREALAQAGHDPASIPFAVTAQAFVADDGRRAGADEVVSQLLRRREALGCDRVLLQLMPGEDPRALIERLGTDVLPALRRELSPAP